MNPETARESAASSSVRTAGRARRAVPGHPGSDPVPGGGDTPARQQEAGPAVFAPFKTVADYFGTRGKQVMRNTRVRARAAMIARLEAAGVAVRRDPNPPCPNAIFARLDDPEGPPIGLPEPADT